MSYVKMVVHLAVKLFCPFRKSLPLDALLFVFFRVQVVCSFYHLVYVSLFGFIFQISILKMMRLPCLETRFLNRQFLLRGRSSAANIYTLSKSFQIVQATQELDSREEKVDDTLYNGLLSSNRACLAESTHPRKRLQAKSLLKKALQHCKQCQEKDNSYSF